jgi:hypothetical protein
MYPKLKFLLIDPNYHSLDNNFKYIYQNIDVIEKSNHRHFMNTLKNKKNDRMRHLNKTTKNLLKVKFVYDDENIHNVLGIEDKKHYKLMKSYENKFYSKKSDNIFDYMIKNNNMTNRVYIIQDYMDIRLTTKLKEYITESNENFNIYFLTDIRTTLIRKLGASDIDILYNSALQIIYLKELQPIYSMLKFRPPFFMNYDIVKKIYDNNYENYEFIKEVFDYVKDNYGIDLMDNFVNKKQYLYFQNDHIFVQPWSPKSSTETRLFVSKKSISKKFIVYDNIEWENKFYYFRFIRFFKYYPTFYEIIKNNKKLHYDGCQDCARELMILVDYILFTETNKQSEKYEFNKLKNILKKNINKLVKYYELINSFVFYDLSERNYKCPRIKKYRNDFNIMVSKVITHNSHKKYRDKIIFYNSKLHSYLVDSNNNITSKSYLVL